MRTIEQRIPVIDLFAGPGGLGEGFSSLRKAKREVFRIALAIEKDPISWRTLSLRKFFHSFRGDVPQAYYDYISNRIDRETLCERHPQNWRIAEDVALLAEMGGDDFPDHLIDEQIERALHRRRDWVLVGGPPCQAYSLVGRSRMIGGGGRAHFETDPRHHLYLHYLRIIAKHKPTVFVMENVKGLLSATLAGKSVFSRILEDLRNPSRRSETAGLSASGTDEYRLFAIASTTPEDPDRLDQTDFVIRAEEFGIPQCRHRVIIVGVRKDIRSKPVQLQPDTDAPTCGDAILDLPMIRSRCSGGNDSREAWLEILGAAGKSKWLEELKDQQDVRLAVMSTLCKLDRTLGTGSAFMVASAKVSGALGAWYHDPQLRGVCNHEARGHMDSDLHRYLFAAVFAERRGRSPLLRDFPASLLPCHTNVQEALKTSKFNDRFRVQIASAPSSTVVSHISKDGHYFIHPKPVQCRSLTVREAARLQTFPDNYFFEGKRTDQYRQVGNAVPPYLARKIADVVAGVLGV